MKGEFLGREIEFKRTKTPSGATCYKAFGRHAGEDVTIRIIKRDGKFETMICEAGKGTFENWLSEDRLQAAMDDAARDFAPR